MLLSPISLNNPHQRLPLSFSQSVITMHLVCLYQLTKDFGSSSATVFPLLACPLAITPSELRVKPNINAVEKNLVRLVLFFELMMIQTTIMKA